MTEEAGVTMSYGSSLRAKLSQSLRAKRGNPWPVAAWIVASYHLAMTVFAQPVVPTGNPQLLQVGPQRTIKTIAAAANTARAGDTIEVDSGTYTGDVAVWTQDELTVRAVGGRVKLIAAGAAAEGKGIWVVRGGQITVEGFEFSGATVPDHNGAGIRFEKGTLTVRNCAFLDNENGILTSNKPELVLKVENSEFGWNGYGDGQTHNLYVGAIASLRVTGSYFHHARVGHLLKSRAAENHIYYNRLTDEPGGQASYELEFPNGGVAYVVGNIIEQGMRTQNPNIISYAVEGYKWPKNELYLVNNTLVDNRLQGGVFLRVKPGEITVKAVNNLLVGRGALQSAAPGEFRNNLSVQRSEFVDAANNDYRLKRGSMLVGKAVSAGNANGINLQPEAQYVHPTSKKVINGLRDPGALTNGSGSPRPIASR